MMNGKITNTRYAASGAHEFGRYALTCCDNGSEGNGKRSVTDIGHLRDLVSRNDQADEVSLQALLCSMFPGPVGECFGSDGVCGVCDENPTNFIWLFDQVRLYWRSKHTGPKNRDTGQPDKGCKTIRAKVLRKHSLSTNVFIVEVEGQEVFVIDAFDLNPSPEEFVYFHQRVICEVEEPTDYLRTVGLDGGENQFGRAEPPDSEETGAAYETSPVGLGGQYELVTGIRADGDSVEVGNPTTVVPPTMVEHCECGQDCKGGHPCPNAPHYVQFCDPSDEVVSTGRVVGGRVLVDNVVCGTDPLPVEDVLFGNHFDGNPS